MIKKDNMLFFLVLGFITFFPLTSAFAGTDCYRECRAREGCSDMSDYDCSGVERRCQYECRHQGPEKSYGAIAYSSKNGAYGFSDGWDNQKNAEKTALKFCKENGSGCKVAVWFYNSCGAVAADGRKTGWGQGASVQEAGQEALKRCKGFFNKHCEVKVSHCSQ